MSPDSAPIAPKAVFFSWTQENRRSTYLAGEFGAAMHHVFYGKRDSTPVLIRYLVQSWRTWKILLQERPKLVFMQYPPIALVLVVYFFSLLFGAKYILDLHTCTFVDPWSRVLWVTRWLAKRAFFVIAHNKEQELLVKEWGVPYGVVSFTPGDYPEDATYDLPRGFNIAFVCSFNSDEPIEEVFAAAAKVPEVNVFITGDYERMPVERRDKRPANCHFTGFLSFRDYVGLLRGADAMLILTKRDRTLLRGSFEAVSLAKPMIISDWPVLRSYFPKGAVLTPNTVDGLVTAMGEVRERHAVLREELQEHRVSLEAEWKTAKERLELLLAGV